MEQYYIIFGRFEVPTPARKGGPMRWSESNNQLVFASPHKMESIKDSITELYTKEQTEDYIKRTIEFRESQDLPPVLYKAYAVQLPENNG